MLASLEVDALALDDRGSTLFHKAAQFGQLVVLSLLAKDGGITSDALQVPDDSFTTPAMLAIQVS